MAGKRIHEKTSWEWYGVKLLFECSISGEPAPETIDKNYTSSLKLYEENIVVVKAQSFEHAYKIAEKKAITASTYSNPYDEVVEWRLVRTLDAFKLFDRKIKSGTEVYSRLIRVLKDIPTDKVVSDFYPEIIEGNDGGPDYNFIVRIKEFNARPNSKG